MEKLRTVLEVILAEAGFFPPAPSLVSPCECAARLTARPEYAPGIEEMYRRLGGIEPRCPSNVGGWDIPLASCAVEFDGEQHFNRYRQLTLDCTLYKELPLFPLDLYRKFCREREPECRKKASGGKYWTSPSAETQFGPSDSRGLLGASGSARWKQRAFYDMLRDFALLVGAPPVARMSVWDELHIGSDGVNVAAALTKRSTATDLQIVDLVRQRIG